jgi:hypothetical protein
VRFHIVIDERDTIAVRNDWNVELIIKYLRQLGYKPVKAQLFGYDWEDNELFIEISLSKENEKK